jgi:hypothetical protein
VAPMRAEEYPADWKAISARIRFVRAKYLCECRGECGRDHHDDDRETAWQGWLLHENAEPERGRCTAVHGKPHPRTGSRVVLTTAHLKAADGKMDCRDDVLRAMCQACHLAYDMEHHVQNRRRSRESALGLIPLEGLE